MATLSAELVARLVDHVTGPARAVAGSLGKLRAAQERNTRALAATRGQMVDAVGAAYVLARALASPLEAAIAFESAMADVRKVVDFPSPEVFSQMSKDIVEMSTRIPIAAEGIAQQLRLRDIGGIKGRCGAGRVASPRIDDLHVKVCRGKPTDVGNCVPENIFSAKVSPAYKGRLQADNANLWPFEIAACSSVVPGARIAIAVFSEIPERSAERWQESTNRSHQ